MPDDERRYGFRFVGRKAVIATSNHKQPGIRHATFKMESNLDRTDRIGVSPNKKRRRLNHFDGKF